MTTVTTTAIAGDAWSNLIDAETIERFQFDQMKAPSLNADRPTLTVSFADEAVSFLAASTFSLLSPSGTIAQVTAGDTSMTSVSLANFFALMRNGDADSLNTAIFGCADTIRSFGGADRISGGAGKDNLIGDAGADIIKGGDGRDLILGGAGRDVLFGDRGDDRINGGAGDDRITGGIANDLVSAARVRTGSSSAR